MNNSEPNDDILGKTYDQVTEYVDLRLQLLKLEAAEHTAKVSSFLISTLILLISGFFCILFLSIVAGFYFSELWGNTFYGFGVIGGIYLVIFIILLSARKSLIKKPVSNIIIQLFFSQHETNQSN